jgi:3-oxoacyl-[acyl-carrier protein] reductase
MDLRSKAAIVTGGGTGVGRAVAIELAKAGSSVLVNYSRSKEEAERTADELRALGVDALAYQADVSDDDACRAMVDAAVSRFGRLDVLVNNAGTTSFIAHADLDRVTDADWDRILAVNLKGPFYCSRAACKPMKAAGAGAIVNVASVAGISAVGSSIPYAASKAALINLTISLVAPGFITGRWLKQGLGPAYDVVKRSIEARSPLRRVCEPEDVAAAVMSLIAGSQMITGQTIVVDGGMLLGS